MNNDARLVTNTTGLALMLGAMLLSAEPACATSSDLFVSSTGSVGIGTNAPASKLDVSGGVTIGTSYVGVDAAPTNGMIIQGLLGIGLTNPTVSLDISNSSATLAAVHIAGNSNTIWNAASVYSIDTGTGGRTYALGSRNGIGFSISDETAFLIRFVIDSSGDVGIATTSPAATLDVNGYAKLAINASAPATCGASEEGAIAYTGTTTHYLCFCNGSNWVQAQSPSTVCAW